MTIYLGHQQTTTMSILHLLFEWISPSAGRRHSFLSRSFSRWDRDRRDYNNSCYIANATHQQFIDVVGAGTISISDSPYHGCGRVHGFSFGVSWGYYGLIGGVMSREEAMKLAHHILEKCKMVSDQDIERETKELEERDEMLAKHVMHL